MKSDNINLKKVVVNKFVESGINISPKTLTIILKLDKPMKLVNQIITDSSFIPNFQSHMTKEFFEMISSNSLEKSVVRNALSKELKLLDKKVSEKEKKREIKAELVNNSEKSSREMEKSLEKGITFNSKGYSDTANVSLIAKKTPKIPKYEQIKVKTAESTKSSFKFKPKAKNYSSNLEIVKDPSGKLYTKGEYLDFYELTQNKFQKLKKLMIRRPDVLFANNIINIIRLSQKNEVSVIGMVNSLRKTKRDNYFMNFEDLTGNINVILKKDTENRELIKLVERTVNDQMVCVNGTYNPGERGGNGIIYADNIFKIDIPYNHVPNHSTEPLSIAFISDTHIGSKEFEEIFFKRFVEFLNGKIGNKRYREIAGRVKYIVINGDLIDGIGIYPTQKNDLLITDIFGQFEKAAELLSEIPDYIEIIYSTGNHEPVRNAIPRPAIPRKYSEELLNIGITCVGNPALVKTHRVETLVFHGDSMLDMNMSIPGLENNKPVETMKEFLKCRHLAPIYGKKTQIAPVSKDWLVIDKVPDILHTGHIHINGMGHYRNVSLVNSGCFQTQTDFMKSFGILPTPGIVPIIELDSINGYELDFKSLN